MSDPMESVDFDRQEDEAFAAFPPPLSPGQGGQEGVTFEDPFGNDEESGDVSKLAEVPAAKRKTVKRPQPKLDSNRLTSDRGLPALRTLFDDVQFKGKGHEADDLRLLMKKMENWAHRLYPKMQFEEFIDKVEKLGKKKEVQTCLKRIRLDMPLTHEDYTGEEEPAPEPDVFRDPDPFNEISFPDHLQRPLYSTPAPAAPPAPSPGFSSPPAPALTEEQLRQIELNRQLALERKLARQQQQQTDSQTVDSSTSADETTSVSTANVPNTSKDREKEEVEEEKEVEKAKDMEQVEEGEDVKQMEQVEEMEEVKEMEEVEQVKEIEQVKEMEPVEGADDMTEVKQQVEDSEVEPTGSSSQLPHKDCEPPAESAQSEKEETSSREERRPDNTSEDGD